METCGNFIGKVNCVIVLINNSVTDSLVSVTKPFFSYERVTDLLLFERKAAMTLQKMQEHFDAGLPLDFQVTYSLSHTTFLLTLDFFFRIWLVGLSHLYSPLLRCINTRQPDSHLTQPPSSCSAPLSIVLTLHSLSRIIP